MLGFFFGLEEDKITWYSNGCAGVKTPLPGLEEDEITWYSNNSVPFICYTLDLEGCEIAGFSNLLLRCKDKEIAGHSNIYWLIVTAAKGLAEDKIT